MDERYIEVLKVKFGWLDILAFEWIGYEWRGVVGMCRNDGVLMCGGFERV